ncbi:MAG: 5-(carboxyamino)imidazole ribonucleotide mutase [Nitrosomonadaceae bacterium]|nr:5-(carboxyamino)imidazole ribonucleotide mutase [Nitrosomonadaceae bacterium]|tara:strand:+ start:142 stop:630 length:489 start_codon:yes stop_codon:yes gene_type:complete
MINPLVYIVMGSDSDWNVMKHAVAILENFNITHGVKIISAHRTPDLLFKFAEEARGLDIQCIIAGAGGAAHLPGMIAAKTTVPVLGVPVNSKHLQGMDSLLSIVQMPKGVPVASFAIGDAGAANAGLFAVSLLAINNSELGERLISFRQEQAEKILAMKLPK